MKAKELKKETGPKIPAIVLDYWKLIAKHDRKSSSKASRLLEVMTAKTARIALKGEAK